MVVSNAQMLKMVTQGAEEVLSKGLDFSGAVRLMENLTYVEGTEFETLFWNIIKIGRGESLLP